MTTETATSEGTAASSSRASGLTLDEEERELVTLDLDALLPTLSGARRDRYAQLRDAVADGEVPGDLTPALESLLELTLQTARARTRYRAEGEQTLTGLYRRTPAGRELAGHLRQVSDALSTLAGQTVESVSVRMRTVGHFTIAIQTDETTITLATRPDAVDVESVAVGT